MKKYIKLLTIFFVILVILFGFKSLKSQNSKTNITNEKTVQTYQANLTIDDGVSAQKFDISSFIGKSALDATKANVKIVASGEGVNAFITGINGRNVDTKKHEFWELSANGTQTQVGAGSYIVQNNDQLVWKISNY